MAAYAGSGTAGRSGSASARRLRWHWRRMTRWLTYALALALNAAQQPEEGERVARQMLARARPNAALHYTHARSLIDLERFDEAELALRECVRLEPRRAEAHDRLAQLVWMRTGNIGEATRASGSGARRLSGRTMRCGPRRLLCCRKQAIRALPWRASASVLPDPSPTPTC